MVAEQVSQLAARVQAMDTLLDSRLRALEGMVQALTDKFPGILSALDANTAQHEALWAKAEKHSSEIMELHDEGIRLNERFSEITQDLQNEKDGLIKSLDEEFQRHKIALGEVVGQAKLTFEDLRTHMSSLHANTGDAFRGFKERVEKLEALQGKSSGGTGGKTSAPADNGYLPVKSFLPKTFDGKEEGKWRKFCEGKG